MKIKKTIARLLNKYCLIKRFSKAKKEGLKLILLNVPSHGNLGDHLIAAGEQQLIEDVYGQSPFIITTAELYYNFNTVIKNIPENSILFITGGGYLGSVWLEEENRILNIIESLPNNKIYILPQTVFYGETPDKQKLLDNASKIYNSHKDLVFMVREAASYSTVINDLKIPENKVKLLPDAALYLNASKPRYKREGILLCLRDDKEKNSGKISLNSIMDVLIKEEIVNFTDTQVPYPISLKSQKAEIQQKIQQFKNASLIITDRLHGMIYGVITGTPTIALDNKTGKVKNVYNNWLKEIPYIQFVEELQEFEEAYKRLSSISETNYNNHQIQKLLKEALKS